jgi:hypothetical protein
LVLNCKIPNKYKILPHIEREEVRRRKSKGKEKRKKRR